MKKRLIDQEKESVFDMLLLKWRGLTDRTTDLSPEDYSTYCEKYGKEWTDWALREAGVKIYSEEETSKPATSAFDRVDAFWLLIIFVVALTFVLR